MENKVVDLRRTARLAGLIDLMWIATGLFAMFYIPSRINTRGDIAVAVKNILSHEFLFRIGILNGLVSTILWVLLVLLFYRLFKSVNEQQAKLMVALVIIQIPTGFIMEAFNITSVMIVKGEILNTFDLRQRQDLAMLFLRINDYLVWVLEFFWGLWLFPLGILVYKSLYLPRFLGVWLIINGIAYVVLCIVTLLLPQYKNIIFTYAFPAMLGELALMLWLIIIGAKNKVPEAPSAL
jgi:hypothetical protein